MPHLRPVVLLSFRAASLWSGDSSSSACLHESLGLQRARVRYLSLRAELAPAQDTHHQLSLDTSDDKARQIEAAADKARARFGPHAVAAATLATPKPPT
ncbi:hypothetical protein ACWGH5_39430 [Streptomyces sp. NPDC054864]